MRIYLQPSSARARSLPSTHYYVYYVHAFDIFMRPSVRLLRFIRLFLCVFLLVLWILPTSHSHSHPGTCRNLSSLVPCPPLLLVASHEHHHAPHPHAQPTSCVFFPRSPVLHRRRSLFGPGETSVPNGGKTLAHRQPQPCSCNPDICMAAEIVSSLTLASASDLHSTRAESSVGSRSDKN